MSALVYYLASVFWREISEALLQRVGIRAPSVGQQQQVRLHLRLKQTHRRLTHTHTRNQIVILLPLKH